MQSRKLASGSAVVISIALAGCSGSLLESKKIDYKSSAVASKLPSLEIPPDLTAPTADDRYAVPDMNPKGSATFSAYNAERSGQPSAAGGAVVAPTTVAPQSIDKMRVERSGTQRWLVVPGTADKVWPQVRDFWQENGFDIRSEEPAIGQMETDWAENRAKIPQDGLRSIFEKVGLGGVYSTSERDKFITRIEAGKNGTTDIFISHRGMQEVYADRNKDTTMWQPRPNDPNLEAAFLGRVMQYLGADAKQIESELGKSAPARSGSAELAKLEGDTLLLSGDFERNWRRTALALDRVGLTVIGQNAERHAYLVQPAPQEGQAVATKKPGFFSRMMGKKTVEPTVYPEMIVYAEPVNGGTRLSLLNKDGSAYRGSDASTWLSRLHTELR